MIVMFGTNNTFPVLGVKQVELHFQSALGYFFSSIRIQIKKEENNKVQVQSLNSISNHHHSPFQTLEALPGN